MSSPRLVPSDVLGDERLALLDAASARSLRWGEVAELAARVGGALEARHGPGARLAATLRADLPSSVLLFACLERGLELLPLHPRFTERERQQAISRFGPTLVEPFPLEEAARLPPPRAPAGGAGGGVLVLTSGSSAVPKAAVLSRAALAASARAAGAVLPLAPGDRALAALPLAHVGGLSILTRALASGSSVVLAERLDAVGTLDALRRFAVTRVSVVPTSLARLLDADRGELAGPSAILVGGAACPAPLLEACAARSIRALATYGLTEASSQVATQRPGDPRIVARGVGPPLPGVLVSVAEGRVRVGGPTLFSGYAGLPGAPLDRARDAEGLFDTGDLGRLEDGVLVIEGRAGDLLVTGGENVSPAEVEERLLATGRLLEVAVVGRDDPLWGQRVVAIVVPREPERFEPDRDLAGALGELAPFKRPKQVQVLRELPRLPSGKVDRRALARG